MSDYILQRWVPVTEAPVPPTARSGERLERQRLDRWTALVMWRFRNKGVILELTKETFDDFVNRLRFHNKGEGVNDHFTRDPIFIVQSRKRVYGFDSQYGDEYAWVDTANEHGEADARTAKRLDALDDDCRDTGKWEKVYYADRWDYVCAHFTKEAAEAFIARKKHDYDELRIYVDCQLYCWEYNAVIEGLLSGKIVFQG